jgi:hypothetical protein
MSNPSVRPGVRYGKIGERFNPHRDFCGFYPPDEVSRQRDLRTGPKRLYERLVRWAGRKGECWYSYERMAVELGKCVRQVKADMATLETYGLVNHQRCGRRLANLYWFLWHPLFNCGDVQPPAPHPPDTDSGHDVQSAAHQDSGKEVQDSTGDVQSAALGDVQPPAHELCSENFIEGIASSSVLHVYPATPATAADRDDDASSNETLKDQVRACLTGFVEGSEIAMPSGKMPVNEIAAGLDGIGATIEDLIAFLKEYVGRWTTGAPATWQHVLVSCQRWLADPATKRTITGRTAVQRALEKEQQERIERERKLDTAVSYREAVAQVRRQPISWALQARLKRIDLISPNDLERQIREWRRCPECGDKGLLGNAIDKDLRFCACVAGEELSYRDGESWPETEICRVHTDVRSLLTAACYELQMSFVGDAIGESTVRDDGLKLEIIPTASHNRLRSIHESEIARALIRIGWQRSVQVVAQMSDHKTRKNRDDEVAAADPIVDEPKPERRVAASSNCRRCGGLVMVYDDGTGHDCKCRQSYDGWPGGTRTQQPH